MSRAPSFPGVLAEIAEAAGDKAAILIADQVGGQNVWIPRRLEDAAWLVEIVGEEAAARICDHFLVEDADGNLIGSRRLTIPRGPAGVMAQARRRAVAALETGSTVRDAARASGLHERTIWRIKARLTQHRSSRQGELPF